MKALTKRKTTLNNKMKLRKGDQVKIISGKDRGKTGVIMHVFSSENKVSIEGLNVYKKRSRPKKAGQKGEIVQVARPLSATNVMLICKSCKKPTRISYKFENNKKVRFCKNCKATN